MSQRHSGYARKERDLYETPEWVTEALKPYIPLDVRTVWEPSAGTGKIAKVLQSERFVFQSDIYPAPNLDDVGDFLKNDKRRARAIITNPPFNKSREFIEHSLELAPFVAMLLRTDYDHARSRTHLFRDCPAFSRKVVLLKRIVWFVEANGKPKASPSSNHAWFIWDKYNPEPPTISYAG